MDTTKTTENIFSVSSQINSTLNTYNTTDLTEFNSPFRHSAVTAKIDASNSGILNNTTNVTMAKYFTPTTTTSTTYNIYYRNAFYYPHSGHNASAGGVVTSTGFKISGDTTNIYYFDDDGVGNLRRYYIVAGTRTYADNTAGTVD